MRVTVVDLRYKMTDVLKALERNEKVTVLYLFGMTKGRENIPSLQRKRATR
jgi:hypothetical protein